MDFFKKWHLNIIRYISHEVELVQCQLEINKVLAKIKDNEEMMAHPISFGDVKNKPKTRRKTNR